MTIIAMSFYSKRGKLLSISTKTSFIVALFLMIMIVSFIGTRPISGRYFGDMSNYFHNYELLFGERFWANMNTTNLIFDNWFYWMASNNIPFETWIWIMSLGYFGFMFVACKKLFGNNNVLLAFVVYLGAFSTFSYGTNGMKAGLAASMFLVAIAYREKLWISIPIALLTYGFHHSMILVIGSYFVTLFVKNPKYYFLGWLFCLLMAAFHITFFQTLFAVFTDEHGAGYLLVDEETAMVRVGFRPDFILYSAVPVYIGYRMITKYKYYSDMYSFLLRIYIMTNAMWMLCMYASYTNRIAYLSWFMYPFVLLYPFISREGDQLQGKYLRRVVYVHLSFTLFMTFVYK